MFSIWQSKKYLSSIRMTTQLLPDHLPLATQRFGSPAERRGQAIFQTVVIAGESRHKPSA
jgi:hypothetical protein